MTKTATNVAAWIRPWYPGGEDVGAGRFGQAPVFIGHVYANCEALLDVDADPREGAGWLDPHQPGTCQACLYRHDPKLYADIFGDDEGDTK